MQCLEYFIFVTEGAGKKQKRVVLTIKAKIDICNRLECGKKLHTGVKYSDIQKIAISGKPLVPEVPDIADFTVIGLFGLKTA
jgi:hypothetical protein